VGRWGLLCGGVSCLLTDARACCRGEWVLVLVAGRNWFLCCGFSDFEFFNFEFCAPFKTAVEFKISSSLTIFGKQVTK
jgi:hypothetical protein